MTNLLEETITFLNDQNLSIEDILFVTNGKKYMSVEEFCFHAKQIDYDNGYGGAEINLSLKLVGKSFWIERDEYDGSEWWTLKKIPDISLFETGTFLIKKNNEDDSEQNIQQMQSSYQQHIIEEAFKKTIPNKINGTIRKLNDKNGFPYLFIL